jgi:hypothetical protein
VKIGTPPWAVAAAAAIGAGTAGRIGGLGVRAIGDAQLLCAAPRHSPEPPDEPQITPEVAAHALYGALAAAADTVKARTVHQTSSKELVKVLGHRCLKRLRRR